MSLPEYWQSKFPDMRPVTSAPGMHTINGIGTMIYGRRDFDEESNTYVKTLCFAVLFLPLFALSAYRVSDAPQGWYFIGRVPLSGLARAWNMLMLLGIVACVGGFFWFEQAHNPETVAAKRLTDGDKLALAGQVGQAANEYREVAVGTTSQVSPALSHLQELIDHHLDGAKAEDVAQALTVAVDLNRVTGRPLNIFEKGLEQARKHADADLKGALAILTVVEPLSPRQPELMIVKETILEKVVAQKPDDVDAVSALAVVLENKKDLVKCETLLVPIQAKLGGREGARILGQIYAQRGKLDESLPLLQAYADEHLERLQAAERIWLDTFNSTESAVIQTLKSGKAPGFNFAQYKNLDHQRQDAMVRDYIDDQLKKSPDILKAQEAIRQESAVVAVALDLGLVLLRRGQTLTDPEARKRELEKAEKTFLAVRTSAGKTDEYRLNLGQVYYWLGKHSEGHKLFDELLADNGRSSKTLAEVSQIMRQVGETSEARALMEEAFNKETDPRMKSFQARARATMYRDSDDRINWLEKTNSGDRLDFAELASARGDKAMQENRDADAAKYLNEALGHYASLPETTASLNNSALVNFSLFHLNGEQEQLNQGIAKMEKAIALEPRNSILVANAADYILSNALWEIAGTNIQRKVLRSNGDFDLLTFLYADKKSRDKYADTVRQSAAVAKARALYERELLLAPKNIGAYYKLSGIYSFCDDRAALKDLAAKLKETQLDLADTKKQRLEDFQGKNEAKSQSSLHDGLTYLEKVVQEARKVKGTTLALALANFSKYKLAAPSLNMKEAASGMVELAEEADALAPSQGTRNQLMFALLGRADMELTEKDQTYAEIAKKCRRSVGGAMLIGILLAEDTPVQKTCLAHADVQRALAMVLKQSEQYPEANSEWTWAMLRHTHPAAAAKVGEFLLKDDRGKYVRMIYREILPLDATEAYREYWMLLLQGNVEQAAEVLQRNADAGVPMPLLK